MDQNLSMHEGGEQSLALRNIKREYETNDRYGNQDPLETNNHDRMENLRICVKEDIDIKDEVLPQEETETADPLENICTTRKCKNADNTWDTTNNTNHLNKRILRSSGLLKNDIPCNSPKAEQKISERGKSPKFQDKNNKKSYKERSKVTNKNMNFQAKNNIFICSKCNRQYSSVFTLKTHINVVHLGNGDYKCGQCNNTFSKWFDLKNHVSKKHKNYMFHVYNRKNLLSDNLKPNSVLSRERKYVCNDCGIEFIEYFKLKEHINTLHYEGSKTIGKELNVLKTNKVYACGNCDERYSLIFHLKFHVKEVHFGIGRYRCVICSKTFSKPYRLRNHTDSNHNIREINPRNNDKKHACDNCEKRYYSLRDLRSHSRRVHLGINDYKCKQCNKTYSSLRALEKHNNTEGHKNFQKYECQVCSKKFSHLSALKQHIVTHNRTEKYICEECGKRFYIFSLLSCHMNDKHLKINTTYEKYQKNKKYTCSDCNKEYTTRFNLKNHIKLVHLQISDYKCEQCNKTFSGYSTLKNHNNSEGHKNLNKLECDYCKKKYSHLSFLVQHIGVHSRAKKFLCEDCGNSFYTHGKLKQHMIQAHIKSRDYQCEKCGKTFITKGKLEQHTNAIHKKIRDFECEYCYKKFQKPHHLQNHIICVHERVKNFVCEQCGSRFLLAHHLRNHINAVHKGMAR